MPNWVFNNVTITGQAPVVKELREQLRKPIQVPVMDDYKQVEPRTFREYTPDWISFQNLIPIPADILDEYHGVCDSEGMKNKNNWYSWNANNWGCKWDANETNGSIEMINNYEAQLALSFDTPWSPPLPIMEKLTDFCRDNDLIMNWSYEEEQGWGGEWFVSSNGELCESEYDIPEAHADFVSRGNADNCHCSEETDQEYWFDDCPGKVAV
jgi:hypothetical protein